MPAAFSFARPCAVIQSVVQAGSRTRRTLTSCPAAATAVSIASSMASVAGQAE